jgi:hypothetical protein
MIEACLGRDLRRGNALTRVWVMNAWLFEM